MIARVLAVLFAATLFAAAAAGCAESVDESRIRPSDHSGVAVPASTLSAELINRLDGAVERVMAQAGIPGAIVGIWAPDGDYVRGFGDADKKTRTPMKTGLFHRIGSQTKPFTVTAVLHLADQGRLGLDDSIGDYVDGVPRGDEITLRQLARMQSGLPNYSLNPEFARALYSSPDTTFTPSELLEFAFSLPAVFAPGDGFDYSNTNSVLLGLVVEKVSGQTLADYIRNHISAPLGMTETTFPAGDAFPKPHAAGYTRQTADGRETTATDWNPSWAWAAGNMISTLRDMRIWTSALATGALLSTRMQQERLQMVDREGRPAPHGYGLGVFNLAGWVGHNGSLPGYQTVSVYLPERQTALVIFVNTDIPFQGADPGTLLATAVTTELTPDHVYKFG